MTTGITIVDFEEKYQLGVDQLLDGIQNEYTETIYAPGSKKNGRNGKPSR